MTHQTDHENTAENAAVTPPPALTTEGRLRARVQTLEEDAERNQGLAKVGARCMREGHQGLIESGRATVEGHRFALSVALDLGTGATWDAIHERVKELRVDSAEPAAVSAAVAPPTNPTHGLSVPHADALWDAVAIPGPHTPTYPEQHERVCRAVRDILDELTPARDDAVAQTALRDRIADKLTAAAYECDGKCGLSERECYDAHPITFSAMAGGTTHVDGSVTAIADAVLAVLPEAADPAAVRAQAFDEAADMLAKLDPVKAALAGEHAWKDAAGLVRHMARQARRMADETATETPEDPARIDRLRPEFTEHASVEAIDAQLDRARRQERRWHIRTEWLIGLRQARTEKPAAGARQDGAET
jgi:hypothetical protein